MRVASNQGGASQLHHVRCARTMRTMAVDLFAAGTVLAAPSGARILRDIPYLTNERGTLRLDVYRPAHPSGARPAVLLINGDLPDEEAIVRARTAAVFHAYGEHLASRGIVGVPFA